MQRAIVSLDPHIKGGVVIETVFKIKRKTEKVKVELPCLDLIEYPQNRRDLPDSHGSRILIQ
jgi:hypothetical protein